MLIQPIDYFLVAWFILAGLSAAYVAWDQFRSNPEPPVMKWGFILITLYMGVFGLLLYVLADKEPRTLAPFKPAYSRSHPPKECPKSEYVNGYETEQANGPSDDVVA